MKQKNIFPILFTVFIDLLGVGIVIPILAPLLNNPNSGILPPESSELYKNIIYGLVLSAYPFAQFLGAPILGTLSDFHGRKKILFFSILGTCISYLIIAFGILQGNLLLIIIGRFLDGLTGGNISVANSAISDISDDTNRTKNFGLIGSAFGLGFIMGPFIGGKLAEPSIVSWFNSSTPFFFAAFLSLINLFSIHFIFDETLKDRIKKKVTLSTGFINLKKAFKVSEIEELFLISFLLTVGFTFFAQVYQLFLIKNFNFTENDIGMLFGYVGIWIVITQGIIVRPLANKYKPTKVLKFSLLGLALFLPLLLIPRDANYLYLIMPLIAITNGITNPNLTSLITSESDKKIQGEILGITQSIQSAGITITPIVGGILFSINHNLPIITGSIILLIAWFVFVKYYQGEKSTR